MHEQLAAAPSREERLKILKQTQQSAREEFPIQLDKLEKLLLNYNPYVILGTFSFCNLTYMPEAGRGWNDGEPVLIAQPHVELVQALILCHYEDEFKCKPITGPEFDEFQNLVGYVFCLQRIKDMPDYDVPSDQEIGKLHFRSALQDHTRMVRNWGYFEQVIRVTKKLYEPLENDIQKELGIHICTLIDTLASLHHAIGQRLQEHSDKVRHFIDQKTVEGVVEAYCADFGDDVKIEDVKACMENTQATFDELRMELMHRSNRFTRKIFAFDVKDLIGSSINLNPALNIEQFLTQWAFFPGELNDCKREHLFLNNPIWIKPMMWATRSKLFWPIPGLLQSFCFEMMEAVVCQNPILKGKYFQRRAVFLEEYTTQIFQKRFPGAQYFRGSKWKNAATKQEGENDLLIIFDSVALVLEAKSGTMTHKGRLGNEERLKTKIEELIMNPAEQAVSFASVLRENPARHSFQTKAGPRNIVDSTNIKQFVCLSITLERFGFLAAQIPQLQTSGLAKQNIPVVPAMSLGDLEIALEFFETPFQLVHYLTRRTAFELKHEFVGDELDLLVFYLQTGFSGKTIPDPKHPLHIAGLSQKLDKFFLNSIENPVFEKPKRELSNWWVQILAEMEKKSIDRRYELGCILLDVPDEEQQIFEKRFKERYEQAKKVNPFTIESIEAMWTPVISEVSNAVLVAAPIREQVVSKRHFIVEQLAEQAMLDAGANQALIILVDVDAGHWPYSGMYLLDRK